MQGLAISKSPRRLRNRRSLGSRQQGDHYRVAGRFVESDTKRAGAPTLGSACASRAGAGVLASANLEHVHLYKKSETQIFFPEEFVAARAPQPARGGACAPQTPKLHEW